jgi:arylsulfatase A-like enzyme
VHYTETHAPYIFLEKDFKIFENDKLFKKNDKILKLNPMNNSNFYVSKGYLPKKVFRKNKYSLNYYIACYDAAISYVDFNIGRLLENVKENTLIILTADHGESLGEHEVYFNHEKLYDEILHIPLIIRDNEYFKRGKRISKAVSAIDIVPTILSRIDPDTYFLNKNKFDGLDLKKISEDKYTERKYIYFYFPKVWGVRDVDKKIKYFLHKNKREELYLLPDEYNNLINNVSPVISSFRGKLRYNLEAWLKIYPIRCDINIKKIPLDEDAKNNLRSLGYLQ